MKKIFLKENYHPILNLLETEVAIKFVKDTFELELSSQLNLVRVSAPLFVMANTGLNDNLNGFERPVDFDVKDLNANVEIVQSLAKWKRMALKKYSFLPKTGIYTDMNAIRRDEELDSLHSIYVDQWDWEMIINDRDRNFAFLKMIVDKIYQSIVNTNEKVKAMWPTLVTELPPTISYISTQELEDCYPNLSPKEREDAICREKKAVFIHQIGWPLKSGSCHDGRAADYDDWYLNGDIMVWYDFLNTALELSSMGIRVDEQTLVKQIANRKEEHKLENSYAQAILKKELPLTIGGGIGQSRLCMFFLQKAHIGEVQVSVWDEEQINLLKKYNINLL